MVPSTPWACPTCMTMNPLGSAACLACGALPCAVVDGSSASAGEGWLRPEQWSAVGSIVGQSDEAIIAEGGDGFLGLGTEGISWLWIEGNEGSMSAGTVNC